jgi:hypothetical protein
MEPERNTRKLANAWIRHPRRGGRPQQNLRHSYRKALIAIGEIDESDAQARFKEWVSNTEDLNWRSDIRKKLRKWNANKDEENANERAERKRRRGTVETTA